MKNEEIDLIYEMLHACSDEKNIERVIMRLIIEKLEESGELPPEFCGYLTKRLRAALNDPQKAHIHLGIARTSGSQTQFKRSVQVVSFVVSREEIDIEPLLEMEDKNYPLSSETINDIVDIFDIQERQIDRQIKAGKAIINELRQLGFPLANILSCANDQ